MLKVPRRLNDIRKRGPRRFANGQWFKRPTAADAAITPAERRLLLLSLQASTPPRRATAIDPPPARPSLMNWAIWLAVLGGAIAVLTR